MKPLSGKNLLLAILVFSVGPLIAQPPAVIPFQSVAKDPMGNPAKNRDIYVKETIFQSSAIGGKRVWEETHVSRSDNDGIFTIYIGKGTLTANTPGGYSTSGPQTLGQLDWANGPFFLNIKIAVSPSIPSAWWIAADNYVDLGTTQMLSVPYALFAGNASVTNVTTSIPPGPKNTFLITDSAGVVTWTTPKAAQQTVTTVNNFIVKFTSSTGQNVRVSANTTAVVRIPLPGVLLGDPIIVTPQADYPAWQVYSAWVSQTDEVSVRFANYTDAEVQISGSQYKIVVLK